MDKQPKPTLNIWQAVTRFEIAPSKRKQSQSNIVVNKNEFLFLVGEDTDFFIFKTENNIKFKLRKNAEKLNKIKKVF